MPGMGEKFCKRCFSEFTANGNIGQKQNHLKNLKVENWLKNVSQGIIAGLLKKSILKNIFNQVNRNHLRHDQSTISDVHWIKNLKEGLSVVVVVMRPIAKIKTGSHDVRGLALISFWAPAKLKL